MQLKRNALMLVAIVTERVMGKNELPSIFESPMSDGKALLRAILSAPADDAPRLIFADWLDENGSATRAHFIRLAVYAHRQLNNGDAHSRALRDGGFTLRDVSWSGLDLTWYGGELVNSAWDRGFVSGIELPTATYLERAAEIFRAQPIVSVRLRDCDPAVEDDLWGWYLAVTDNSRRVRACEVPACLRYPYLEESCRRHSRQGGAFYASLNEAQLALSAACVAYGRKLADLPELPREHHFGPRQ